MLTDAQCKNATCSPDKPRARLADSGGLYLEVSPAGSKRWFLKCAHYSNWTLLLTKSDHSAELPVHMSDCIWSPSR